ncbi:MAG: CpaD family pilus assembly lipoprotein [Holosporaceae bacterium]|jgi:O-acetyl-ADP-ribose deacetylase (regulator of RNase III)|nr:CpaD family pilus assembly lipoprotein [Holosporaceae bacterium]
MLYEKEILRITSPGIAILAGLLMSGCNSDVPKAHGFESIKIDVKENRDVHFFECPCDFHFNNEALARIENVLKKARGEGVENIAFTLISNRSIPFAIQEKTRKLMYEMMHKYHFLRTRIKNMGICVYEEAKVGVRIDVLQYEITQPNCSIWSEHIGDIDSDKDLPKYGTTERYNMGEMIANKADIISPREYAGHAVTSAIAAVSSLSTAGGGGVAAATTSSVGSSNSKGIGSSIK